MIEILKPDFSFADERGVITQLVHKGYNQINSIFTLAGHSRGNMHYHRKNIEAFYIIKGSLAFECRDIGGSTIETYYFGTGDFWRIQPNIGHDFHFKEDTFLISMYSMGVNLPDGTKDIIDMVKL